MARIEWREISVNPFVGCSKNGPGCLWCKAEARAAMLCGMERTRDKYAGAVRDGKWTGHVFCDNFLCLDRLPKKPKLVSVCSMSDIFHENIEIEDYLELLRLIRFRFSQHAFLFQTRRIARAVEICGRLPLPPNVWLGASASTQGELESALPELLKIKASRRFLCLEPLLGEVDLEKAWQGFISCSYCGAAFKGGECPACGNDGGEKFPFGKAKLFSGIDWILLGGESGFNARSMREEWARGVRDFCARAKKPFFFKGWGEWIPEGQARGAENLPFISGRGARQNTIKNPWRKLDGKEHLEFPKAIFKPKPRA